MKAWHKLALFGLSLGSLLFAFRSAKASPLERFRKGVFIEFSLFDDVAEELRRAGLDFVIVQTAVQALDKPSFVWRDREALDKVIERINPPGLKPLGIWLWGWPIPEQYKDFVGHLAEVIAHPAVIGYVLNIEAKAWSSKDTPEVQLEAIAGDFIDRLRAETDKPLFISSHGRADYAPLPWKALARLDGGMPQVYDRTNKYGPGFAQRCIDSYRKLGFKHVWPTLGAAKAGSERMQEQLLTLPCVEAVTWWTWTSIAKRPERKAVIKGAELCQPLVA